MMAFPSLKTKAHDIRSPQDHSFSRRTRLILALGTSVVVAGIGLTVPTLASAEGPEAAANSAAVIGPTVSCTTNSAIFNTGFDAASTTTKPILALGAKDANWTVAGGWEGFNHTDGKTSVDAAALPPTDAVFVPALVGNAVPDAWSASPYSNAQWISYPSTSVDHNQEWGIGDWYFKYQFTMDAAVDPAEFSLDVDWLADNDVAGVWINNAAQTGVHLPQTATAPYIYQGYLTQNEAKTTLTHNWTQGLNTILVEVKSSASYQGFDAQVVPSVVCPTLTPEQNAAKILINSPFSILAGAATTVPGATVSGAVGADAALTISGGSITGKVYPSADPVVVKALANLSNAYTSLKALTPTPTKTLAGDDLGGQTVLPGVYHRTAALAATSDFTFDAKGDSNAIFVIQSDAALNTTASTKMLLLNGANPANIFWVTTGAATLGASSTFYGNVISNAAVTIGASSTLNGRALSVTAAVTLGATVTIKS